MCSDAGWWCDVTGRQRRHAYVHGEVHSLHMRRMLLVRAGIARAEELWSIHGVRLDLLPSRFRQIHGTGTWNLVNL